MQHHHLTLAIGALLSGVCSGQSLVKDINTATSNAGSVPTALAASLGTIGYFSASDGVNGAELWRSDGTSSGTFFVKDINPAAATGSSISGITAFLGGVVFAADDGTNGAELWRSDGTTAGTVLVKDINPGGSSSPASFFVALGKVWFAATDGGYGVELWSSDGTAAGTSMVADVNPGSASSSPAHFTLHNGKVYFSAADVTHGRELWVTDGTPAGTSLVLDLNPGAAAALTTNATYSAIVALNGKLLVAATTAAFGAEWWVSDGTAAGTSLVKDVYAGTSSGIVGQNANYDCVAGGKLFWYGNDGALGREVWFTDGTAAGTGVVDINPGTGESIPFPFYGWNGKCYVQATDGSTGYECWVTDGTAAGTFQLKDINPGSASAGPTAFVGLASTLLFAASDGLTGSELWKTDGTSAGTMLVRDINPGSLSAGITGPIALAASALFAANDGSLGIELWGSDGTAAGTQLVKDINTTGTITGSSNPASFTAFKGKAFFTANDGASGVELWSSDGTAAGTALVKDVNPGSSSASPANLTVALGRLWFSATDGTNGIELWSSDGTAAGTVLVRDINAGAPSSSPAHFTELGGRLYFSAADAAGGRELWVTDGTTAGTALVYDFNPGPASGLTTSATFSALQALNGKLLVAATTPALGAEWWVTDGTAAGTSLVKDVFPGSGSGIASLSGAAYSCVAGGKLFWYGSDGALGREVWFTDGTAAGTGVVDINPGAAESIPFPFYGWNGKCYVQASDASTGYECWVTDGTAAGTFLLKDIYPGAGNSSSPTRFAAAGDRLFFYASDGTATTGTGGELWVTDGTGAGTVLVKDINPGIARGLTGDVIFPLGVGRRVLFAANDGVSGSELWVSDGTAAGTKPMGDLWPGASSGASTTAGYALANGWVLAAANNGVTGTELYAFTAKQLGVSEAETFGASCAGTGSPAIGIYGGPPALGNAGFLVTLVAAAPAAPCALFVAGARGDLPVGPCTFYPSLVPTIAFNAGTNAGGTAVLNLPVPSTASLLGGQVYAQWVVADAGGPLFGLASASNALRLRIGQ